MTNMRSKAGTRKQHQGGIWDSFVFIHEGLKFKMSTSIKQDRMFPSKEGCICKGLGGQKKIMSEDLDRKWLWLEDGEQGGKNVWEMRTEQACQDLGRLWK